MLEIPEAKVISEQINKTIKGKTITNVIAANSPHKFAWFYKDSADYADLLVGKRIGEAAQYGGHVEITVDGAVISFNDGVNIRYHAEKDKRPEKHQLLLEFEDNSALSVSVAMYGGIFCFKEGEFDNFYYKVAKEKPSPLSDEFDFNYFKEIFNDSAEKLSAKAFLATEQRIPGLGNGILQDILLNAKIHPKTKIRTLGADDKKLLFKSIKNTISEMVSLGGRDTEKDFFGNAGGYKAKMSKNTVLGICPNCGGAVKKENYMGGSIYYCEECQIAK